MRIIGRIDEQRELERLCNSSRPEFVVVYGRRRVGKTYLIRNYFENSFAFYATGVASGNARAQFASFNKSLKEYGAQGNVTDWFQAFDQLEQILSSKQVQRDSISGKRIVFIDEMPWLDAPRTDFKMALELFWNKWGSAQDDLILIACGSATSWIINNLLKNRGGLHNRVTARIRLEPFSLKECEEYYRANEINMSRLQMVEGYMIFGGIPFYLDLFHRNLGLVQNIDRLCFSNNGALKDEFNELFHSLFKHADKHESIVRALATKAKGLTRIELAEKTKQKNGGGLSTTLNELEQCGFIRRYRDIARAKNGQIYQLIDPFSLFYLRFMQSTSSECFWTENYLSGKTNAWEGYAFELVCLLHINQLRAALGIAGVSYEAGAWRSKKSNPGAQIDLVLQRADGVTNLCEMKFSRNPYTISKPHDETLRHKVATFIDETKTKNTLHLTLISPFGLKQNTYWNTVQAIITLDDLFG